MRSIAALIAAGVASVAFSTLAGQQAPAPPFRPAVRAGSVIYLSGALPMDGSGRIVGDTIATQTRRALDNLRGTLEANGSSLSKVASVHVYLKRASDFAAMNEVYATYWPQEPPARTTIITNLVVPDALVEVSMIALANDAARNVIHPDGWLRPASPYSYGIRSGDTLFLSGLVPRNGKDNTPVKGDITVQTNAVLGNAAEILKAGGMDFGNVVSARVYLTDVANFESMNAAYRKRFTTPPARATVRAGLTSPDYLVEMTLTAVAGVRTAITTPNADGSAGQGNPNLSSAIAVGNRLFVSGTLGNTASNGGDVAAQTREALARIGRTLKAAGFEWSHVVDGTVYLTDVASAPAMNGSYRDALGPKFPARVAIETGLMNPAASLEIMMTAAK